MKLSQIMTHGVQTAAPSDTLKTVAEAMAGMDIGSLPVCEGDRLVGIITDRDIAIRAVARGLGPETTVHQVMSKDVESCFEDDDIADVAATMARKQIRRLPVVDRHHKLIGVVALGDLAREDKEKRAGHTLSEISEPGR